MLAVHEGQIYPFLSISRANLTCGLAKFQFFEAQTPKGDQTIQAEANYCKEGFPCNLTTYNSEIMVRGSNLALSGAIFGQAQ